MAICARSRCSFGCVRQAIALITCVARRQTLEEYCEISRLVRAAPMQRIVIGTVWRHEEHPRADRPARAHLWRARPCHCSGGGSCKRLPAWRSAPMHPKSSGSPQIWRRWSNIGRRARRRRCSIAGSAGALRLSAGRAVHHVLNLQAQPRRRHSCGHRLRRDRRRCDACRSRRTIPSAIRQCFALHWIRVKPGLSVLALAQAAQTPSDNGASNLLLRQIGGPAALTGLLALAWR